jgi:hypothetical protein
MGMVGRVPEEIALHRYAENRPDSVEFDYKNMLILKKVPLEEDCARILKNDYWP